MEQITQNLQVGLNESCLQCNTPSENAFAVNEEISIASEVVAENPEAVVIDKTVVIQKKLVLNTKVIIPKGNETLNHAFKNPSMALFSQTSSTFEGRVSNEVDIASQESLESKMDIASQESLESKMDISSQESLNSKMESTSQECDVLNVNPENSDQQLDLVHTRNTSQQDRSVSNAASYTKAPKRKAVVLSNGGAANGSAVYEEEENLSLREEALAKREAAVLLRERAVTKRESVSFRQAPESDVQQPKRLKVKAIFQSN